MSFFTAHGRRVFVHDEPRTSRGPKRRRAKLAFVMLLFLILASVVSYQMSEMTRLGYLGAARGTTMRERVLDALGKRYVSQHDYLEAIVVFEILLETYPESRFGEEALCRVGLCWLCLEEPDMAMKTWDRFLKLYPESKYTDMVRRSYLFLVRQRAPGVSV